VRSKGAGRRRGSIDRIFRQANGNIDNRYLLHIRIIESHGRCADASPSPLSLDLPSFSLSASPASPQRNKDLLMPLGGQAAPRTIHIPRPGLFLAHLAPLKCTTLDRRRRGSPQASTLRRIKNDCPDWVKRVALLELRIPRKMISRFFSLLSLQPDASGVSTRRPLSGKDRSGDVGDSRAIGNLTCGNPAASAGYLSRGWCDVVWCGIAWYSPGGWNDGGRGRRTRDRTGERRKRPDFVASKSESRNVGLRVFVRDGIFA